MPIKEKIREFGLFAHKIIISCQDDEEMVEQGDEDDVETSQAVVLHEVK